MMRMRIRRKRPMFSRKRRVMMRRWRMRRKFKSSRRPKLRPRPRKRAIIPMDAKLGRMLAMF